MIIVLIGFVGFGGYLLIRGDGQAKLVGVVLIGLAALFGFLIWVALYAEQTTLGTGPIIEEVHHV